MGKKTYIGVDSVARKVKKAYIGVDNVARKIKKMYIGDADGKARLFFSGGDFPFTGVVYPNYEYSSTNKYLCYQTWNGSDFSDEKSILWSNMYTNSNYYNGFAVSKNGRVIVPYCSTSSTNISVAVWDETNQTYTSASGNGFLIDIMRSNVSGSVYMSHSIYVSNNGEQIIVPVYSSTGSYYSPYASLFDKQYSSGSAYLLFFDVNIEAKTFSFSKGIYIYGVHDSNSEGHNGFANGYSLFSESDDNLIFVSGNSEYIYLYYINIKEKTANFISSINGYGCALSSNGKYLKVYNYETNNNECYYLNGTSRTKLSTIFNGGAGSNTSFGHVFVPDENQSIMYCPSGSYIYCYAVNGTTITSLGSIYTFSKFADGFHLHSWSVICDMHNNKMLSRGAISTTTGTGSLAYTQAEGIADVSIDSSGKITAFKITRRLSGTAVANLYQSNVSKFINKDDM